jgi:hypothetical protein
MDSGLLRRQPFMIWGGARVSLGGVPCAPLPPMTLLSRGLVAPIQKRIFLGRPYAMGFDWRPRTLLSSMGGILDIRHFHPRGAPLFRLFGVLMGGLHSPPLLLLVIVVGLPSPPLLLGLRGPRQDRCIGHLFWGALDVGQILMRGSPSSKN